jgi:hypothetical protein
MQRTVGSPPLIASYDWSHFAPVHGGATGQPRARPPARLYVGGALASLYGIAVLVLLSVGTVVSGAPLWSVVITYLNASILVVAPLLMMMGNRLGYSATVAATAGLIFTLALELAFSGIVLVPLAGPVVVAVLAVLTAPAWVAMWLVLSRPVEQSFDADRKGGLTVYLNAGIKEPVMVDPKENPEYPTQIVLMPVYHPWYGGPYGGGMPVPYLGAPSPYPSVYAGAGYPTQAPPAGTQVAAIPDLRQPYPHTPH